MLSKKALALLSAAFLLTHANPCFAELQETKQTAKVPSGMTTAQFVTAHAGSTQTVDQLNDSMKFAQGFTPNPASQPSALPVASPVAMSGGYMETVSTFEPAPASDSVFQKPDFSMPPLSYYPSPAVPSIQVSASDSDPLSYGNQVVNHTSATYSGHIEGNVSKDVTWEWSYRVNGGASVTYQKGSGTDTSITFDYDEILVDQTYEWTLTVTDGSNSFQKKIQTEVISDRFQREYGQQLPGTSISLIQGAATIFLDFDGAETDGYYSGMTVLGKPFDGSQATINEIARVVAEKFSPFNIEVTTKDPYSGPSSGRYGYYEAQKILHIVVGDLIDKATGESVDIGAGFAVQSALSNPYSDSSSGMNVGFVNNELLKSAGYLGSPMLPMVEFYNAAKIGAAIAHEAGHALGLHHQSDFSDGYLTSEYALGNGTQVALMGYPFGTPRQTWQSGLTEYGTFQDDMATIAAMAPNNVGFGYRPDDHMGSIKEATKLSGFGTALSAKGIIEKMSDADYFEFTTTGGLVQIHANVAKDDLSYLPGGLVLGPADSEKMAMLDLQFEVRDEFDRLIATVDTSTLGESLSIGLKAGKYYVVVKSHGLYGDVGQYSLDLTLPL